MSSKSLLLLICVTGWFQPAHATQPSPSITVGVIETIDAAKRLFMLRGGVAFVAGPRVKLSTRRIGDEVTVIYEVEDDLLIAVEIKRRPIALHAPIDGSSDQEHRERK